MEDERQFCKYDLPFANKIFNKDHKKIIATMNTTAGFSALFLQKSFWLFAVKALPVLVLFLITILYSRQLPYDDYGKFQSVWMYTNLMNIIISFGVTSVILSSNLQALKNFFRKHWIKISGFYACLFLITITAFFLFEKNFNITTKSLLVMFVAVQCVNSFYETLLVKQHKEKIIFIINSIYAILFFGWHYFMLMHIFILSNLVTGVILLSVVKVLILFFLKSKTPGNVLPLDNKLFIKHWLFLGFNDLAGIFSRWIDKLLLIYLLSAGDFALYFNGSFEIPLFGLLVSVVGSVMLIEMSKNISSPAEVIRLFNESFRLLSLIVFPLFLFLLFFHTPLFGVVFKHRYDVSLPVFVISIFILLIRINNYSSILQYYQKGNIILKGSVLDIVLAVVLMFILYPLWGTRGVALATVIATFCQVFFYLWHSAKILHIKILSLIPVKMLVTTFAGLAMGYGILFYVLAGAGDVIKLSVALLITIVFILVALYKYFSKKHETPYGIITKT